MRSNVRPLGRQQSNVDFRETVGVDPAALENNVGKGQGLLRVVGIQAGHPPAIGLLFPGLHAVHVIDYHAVVGPYLLGTEALDRSP